MKIQTLINYLEKARDHGDTEVFLENDEIGKLQDFITQRITIAGAKGFIITLSPRDIPIIKG